jgi:RNA polymerase sigma-70 factor, ECF subfamily
LNQLKEMIHACGVAIVEAVRGAVGDKTGQSDPLDSLAQVDDGQLGPGSGDAGQLLEACRQYLLMIANDVIGPELQAKLGPSDLVQDTFLEAQRHIGAFRGRTRAELRAWLRRILECRLANVRRSYLATEKRAAVREVTLEMIMAKPEATAGALATSSLSPSSHAVRKEWARLLDEALVRLPENYRQAVAWRHQEQLAWDEIGRRMGCSAGAARKLWSRAICQLRCDLAGHGVLS